MAVILNRITSHLKKIFKKATHAGPFFFVQAEQSLDDGGLMLRTGAAGFKVAVNAEQ